METVHNSKSRSPCVFSNVLDLLGDKWTLLVVRDLLFFDKHEFKEFLASPESIATNILSDRLRRLLQCGVIAESIHPSNRSRKFYYLTERGKDLIPLLFEIAAWGEKHLPHSEMMQPLFERVKGDPKKFQKQLLINMSLWEKINLGI